MSALDFHAAVGVREGDVLAGKYRVHRILGMGGMGMVVSAHHLRLDTPVAIKFLLPSMVTNEEAVARFAREARAAAKIRSEHVARVLDVGSLDSGAPYIVMEFLEGLDLAAWLQQRGPLPIEQAVDFVLQASVALAEAHGMGIVHRDLKPSNLFCVRGSDGRFAVKVLDFGISKISDDAFGADGVTRTSGVLGSPLYMSPEQMQSPRDVDATTDLWALGVVLYELLTGRSPFAGETQADVCLKIVMGTPPPVRAHRPEVPAKLEEVIGTCLQKDRKARYPNIALLALALLPFSSRQGKALVDRIAGIIQASGLSTSALSIPASPARSSGDATLAQASVGGTLIHPSGRRRTTLLVSLATGAAAAAMATAATVELLPRHAFVHADAAWASASLPVAAAFAPDAAQGAPSSNDLVRAAVLPALAPDASTTERDKESFPLATEPRPTAARPAPSPSPSSVGPVRPGPTLNAQRPPGPPAPSSAPGAPAEPVVSASVTSTIVAGAEALPKPVPSAPPPPARTGAPIDPLRSLNFK